MRVLFDNNVPAPLRRHLEGHEVRTARQMGWQELENGDLLTAAETVGFDMLLTGDKNLSYQQKLEGRSIALVVLGTTRWGVLREHTDPVVEAGEPRHAGKFRGPARTVLTSSLAPSIRPATLIFRLKRPF